MIFGIRRAAAALALTLVFGGLLSSQVRADLFQHDIPREVAAMDTSTGEPMMAPPIPYGHYAKDPMGHMASKGSMLHAKLGGLGHGGAGLLGHGGNGLGNGLGHGGNGLGHGSGFGCKDCGDGGFGHGNSACGNCGGSGMFSGKKCGGCGGQGFLSGLGHGHRVKGVAAIPAGYATTGSHGSAQSATSQGMPVSACGEPGCGFGKGHGKGCGICGGSGLFKGKGCGPCGGSGLLSHGNGCGTPGCGDAGCGGGHGGFGHGGGKGFGHGGGTGCSACGGQGCGLCSKLGGMAAQKKAALSGLLHPHAGKIKYFVGPGGPVPITPGYVPYVNTTRSPRDYFAFPPFTQ